MKIGSETDLSSPWNEWQAGSREAESDAAIMSPIIAGSGGYCRRSASKEKERGELDAEALLI